MINDVAAALRRHEAQKTFDFWRNKPAAPMSGGSNRLRRDFVVITINSGPEDSAAVVQAFRRESSRLRSLAKVVIGQAKTVIHDINRDTMEFEGLGFGAPALEDLLRELGVVCDAQSLERAAARGRDAEFSLSARFPWGWERASG